ncbi:plasmid stabilization protein [Deltaproteobacteria bacterium]|nr:plasmid stabilization protein [Deltaproteobacteria bacterium]
MRVIWSVVAERDLNAIVEYIAQDNIHAALDMDELLRNSAAGLGIFPNQGRAGRIPGTRELLVRKQYILVYRVVDDAVEIVTALHTSRQWPLLD